MLKLTNPPPGTILFTGGYSDIGIGVIDALINANYYVYNIDNLSGKRAMENFDKINYRTRSSFTDLSYSQYIWPDIKFNSLVHLAAYTDIETADANLIKVYEDNLIGTVRLLERCVAMGTKFIYLHHTTPGTIGLVHQLTLTVIQNYIQTKNLQSVIIPIDGLSLEEIQQILLKSII